MAKRFTDTEKWKKPFIRSLEAPYKLLWLYICDDCDYAGIWQVDIEVAQIRIGEKITERKALEFFGDKVIPIDDGSKWFIPSFVEFQYPTGLNQNNNAHVGILKILEKYKNQIESFKPLKRASQGPLDMVKDKDKDKDKEMDKEKDKENPQKIKIEVTYPWPTENFINAWESWKDYKAKDHKFKYRSAGSEQATLNELTKLSAGYEETAIQILQQSMAKGWKGLFELKTNENNGTAKTHQTRTSHITDQQLHESLTKRFGGR